MAKKVNKDRPEKRATVRPADGRRKSAEDQPRPRLPLFSGKDPTLAERFEEELYGRKLG
jgi:hypothetical protein